MSNLELLSRAKILDIRKSHNEKFKIFCFSVKTALHDVVSGESYESDEREVFIEGLENDADFKAGDIVNIYIEKASITKGKVKKHE